MSGSNIKASQPRQPAQMEIVDNLRPLNGGLENISGNTKIINTTDKLENATGPITKGI